MSLWIMETEVVRQVVNHFREICDDPNIGVNIFANGTERGSGQVTYPSQSRRSVGCDLIAALVRSPGRVEIRGGKPEWVLPGGRTLDEVGGAVTLPDAFPRASQVICFYDATSCN